MDMEIRLKLRKVGNSLMIAIPSQIVKDLKLKAGDDMLLDYRFNYFSQEGKEAKKLLGEFREADRRWIYVRLTKYTS